MTQRPACVAAAALLFNPAIGSLYAWSVFVRPLELATGAPRADVSMVFAVAVAAFATGCMVAPKLYAAAPPGVLLGAAGGLAAAGLWLAGDGGMAGLLVGYGGLFGFGTGFAYSVMLQALNLAMTKRRGLWNGLGVAAFAVGAMLSAPLLMHAAQAIGPFATFRWMALGLLAAGLLGGGLLLAGGARLPDAKAGAGRARFEAPFPWIWLGFMLAASAGVGAIAHAAGLVAVAGGSEALATLAVAGCAAGNAAGRIFAGWLTDRWPPRRVAGLAHATALASFILLLVGTGPVAVAAGVMLQGLAYGLVSGVFPAMNVLFFGPARYGHYFGWLMVAWGVAGLLSPTLAGRAFDTTGGYVPALLVGAVLSVAAFAVSRRLVRPA